MLSDKVHIRLQATGGSLVFVEVWVVDDPGPWNSWNQDGLPGPWLGPGKGSAWLDGKEHISSLYGEDSATSIVSLNHFPYPGECRKGDNGVGQWGKGSPIGSGYPLIWTVLNVET